FSISEYECPTSVYPSSFYLFFFLNEPDTTEIDTLSLHDALPIYGIGAHELHRHGVVDPALHVDEGEIAILLVSGESGARYVDVGDRKSTRLNSSHVKISYAVFCLKKITNLIVSSVTF